MRNVSDAQLDRLWDVIRNEKLATLTMRVGSNMWDLTEAGRKVIADELYLMRIVQGAANRHATANRG